MAQPKLEMAEKLRLCFSADIHFGTRPASQASSDEQRIIRKVHGDSESWFQLAIEPEVSLSTPKCKEGNAQDGNGEENGGVVEAQIHIVFVLTPFGDADDKVYPVNLGMFDYAFDFNDDSDDDETALEQTVSIAHYHSESHFLDAAANIDPDDMAKLSRDDFDRVYRTTTGLILEGNQEPIADVDAKLDMATARIQKKLKDLAVRATADDAEYWGLGYFDLREGLDDCLEDLTPMHYLRAVFAALARVRALYIDYEKSKSEPEA
ncbi:hypothetical protein PG991_012268 [Apiospora marii]|uniref:Uncharacterized protein n=1 Tax=Apiospora marii TaxID=335849 RepID=A0ABR1R9F0_9PEZI